MESPTFYLVADGNAYALDEDGTAFGAAVFQDGTIDWENSYAFSDHLEEDELDYVAHMCQLLVRAQALTTEQNNQEVFTK